MNHDQQLCDEFEALLEKPSSQAISANQFIDSIQQLSKLELQRHLQAFLHKIDDALFELAEKASNNNLQTHYFDAMREIRIRRQGLEIQFFQQFDHNFIQLQHTSSRPHATQDKVIPLKAAHLSLVQHDELEENLAISSMVTKAVSQNTASLRYIHACLSSLFGTELHESATPLHPKTICDCLHHATASLEVDIPIKLVIYKLFDKHLLSQLDSVYQTINQLLADAHITPSEEPISESVETTYTEHPTYEVPDPQPTKPAEPDQHKARLDDAIQAVAQALNAEHVQVDAHNFAAIQALLTHYRQAQPRSHLSSTVSMMESTQLLEMLNQLQAQRLSNPNLLGTQFREHMQQYFPQAQNSLKRIDDDTIDIVGMLFDFIHQDDLLSASAKSNLLRLQVPFIKLALLDKGFFNKQQHPARKLLNDLAQASLNIDANPAGAQQQILDKINQIVDKILTEFVDDANLFNQLHEDFHDFSQTQQHRMQRLEQRQREIEEGKAKTEHAKRHVEQVLQQQCAQTLLPDSVADFLENAWKQVLYLTALRQGVQSPLWQQQTQVIHDLLQMLDPKNRQHQGLLARFSSLIQCIEQSLDDISFSRRDTQQHLANLNQVLQETLFALPAELVTPAATDFHQGPDLDKLDGILSKFAAQLSKGASIEPPLLTEVAQEIPKKPIINKAPIIPLKRRKVHITPTAEDPFEKWPELRSDPDALQAVEQLCTGAWCQLMITEHQPIKCKLAAKISMIDRYLFVDAQGRKVADLKKTQVAAAYKNGTLQLLDDRALFDRALESVITQLIKTQDAQR